MKQGPTDPRPKSIEALLQLGEDDLRRQARSIDIPTPEEITQESELLLAFLEEPPVVELAGSKGGWWQQWLETVSVSWPALAAAVGCLGLVWWGSSSLLQTHSPLQNGPIGIEPSQSIGPQARPRRPSARRLQSTSQGGGTAKGNVSLSPNHEGGLHIGTWDDKRKRLQRLASGARCLRSQQLVFGFSLMPPGGYLYLWLDEVGQPALLLLPFVPAKPALWKALPRVQLLQRKGVVQQYQLKRHRGALRFILLQTRRPLRPQQLTQLQKQLNASGAEHPTKRWVEMLRRLRRQKVLIATDQVEIKVEAR